MPAPDPPASSAPGVTPEQREELRRLLAEATEGPWRCDVAYDGRSYRVTNPAGDAELGDWLVAGDVRWKEDGDLICLLRNLADAALSAERERVRETDRQWREAADLLEIAGLPVGGFGDAGMRGAVAELLSRGVKARERIREAEAESRRLRHALEHAPMPSSSGNHGELIQRLTAWWRTVAKPALEPEGMTDAE